MDSEAIILKQMEEHRRQMAELAAKLDAVKKQKSNYPLFEGGMKYLINDLHLLRGRFMQVAETQNWQLSK